MTKILNENLKDLTNNLDDELGGVLTSIEDLEAIETELSSIMVDLGNIKPGDTKEINRIIIHSYPSLKIISSLLSYSLKDLTKHSKNSNDLSNELLSILINDVKNEKKA